MVLSLIPLVVLQRFPLDSYLPTRCHVFMPPARSIHPRDTPESRILLSVLLPLLLVPIFIILFFLLAKGSKSSTPKQRSRQPTFWPGSYPWEQMPFVEGNRQRHRGLPIPGRDYCPGISRRVGGFLRGRFAPPLGQRYYSGYGDLPPLSRRRNMAGLPELVGRRQLLDHRGRHPDQFALARHNGFGSGENIGRPQQAMMPIFAPRLRRRRARSPPSSGSDSSLGGRRAGIRRGPGLGRQPRRLQQAAYRRRSPGGLDRGMRRARGYPIGGHGQPYGGPPVGGVGAFDPALRYPRDVYHRNRSYDGSENDSSENDYSGSGYGSHDLSPYPGNLGESSSDSDRYDRRYNGRGGRVGGPNPRDPYRTGRSLTSDFSTYSDHYGGYRGNSSDAYNSPPY